MKKICERYGIQTHFKGSNTIRNLLGSPKDKDSMVSKSGAIYWFQCGDLCCDDEYIGETSRTFGESFKEHLRDPSPIHHHSNHTGHPPGQNKFQIIGKEGHGLARNIKESIFIRVNNPILNGNIGKFNLPHIWDRSYLTHTVGDESLSTTTTRVLFQRESTYFYFIVSFVFSNISNTFF